MGAWFTGDAMEPKHRLAYMQRVMEWSLYVLAIPAFFLLEYTFQTLARVVLFAVCNVAQESGSQKLHRKELFRVYMVFRGPYQFLTLSRIHGVINFMGYMSSAAAVGNSLYLAFARDQLSNAW